MYRVDVRIAIIVGCFGYAALNTVASMHKTFKRYCVECVCGSLCFGLAIVTSIVRESLEVLSITADDDLRDVATRSADGAARTSPETEADFRNTARCGSRLQEYGARYRTILALFLQHIKSPGIPPDD